MAARLAPDPDFKPSIAQQIDEVRRELAQRQQVYRGLIGQGKMRQSEADYRIGCMTAVLATLEYMQTHRETIIAAVKATKQAETADA